MATIWRADDQLGRSVTFTDRGRAQIMERRPIIAGHEEDVRQAVVAADSVIHDAHHPDRENHYRRSADGLYLKVCVGHDAAGNGVVITAHPTQRIEPRETTSRSP